jgi:hypothetical protein
MRDITSATTKTKASLTLTTTLSRYTCAVVFLTVLAVVSSGALDRFMLLGLSTSTTSNSTHIRHDDDDGDGAYNAADTVDTGEEEGLLMKLARLDPHRQNHDEGLPKTTTTGSAVPKFVQQYCNLQGMTLEEWYPKNKNNDIPQQTRAPHFLLLGAKKAGTTSLSFNLHQHPDIGMARRKELLFFLPPGFPRKFVRHGKVLVEQARQELLYGKLANKNTFDWDWLLNDTAAAVTAADNEDGDGSDDKGDEEEPKKKRNSRIAFEATPGYIFHSSLSRQFVLCTAPWVKLLVILRDPVERLWSHYNFLKQYSRSDKPYPSVEEWISNDLEQLRKFGLIAKEATQEIMPTKTKPTTSTSLLATEELMDYAWGNYTIAATTTGKGRIGPTGEGSLGRGIYTVQIRLWMNALADIGRDPSKNFLIVRNEDMSRNPQAVFDRIISWLGLPPYTVNDFKEKMITNYTAHGKSSLTEETRRQLQAFYAPFNRQLSELLQDEHWSTAWEYGPRADNRSNTKVDLQKPILSWPPPPT